jgi:hypothetical protein
LEEKLLKFITLNACWKGTSENCILFMYVFESVYHPQQRAGTPLVRNIIL